MLLGPKQDADIYESIRDLARKFADEVIRPRAEELDRDESFPTEIFAQMAALGLFGVTVPDIPGCFSGLCDCDGGTLSGLRLGGRSMRVGRIDRHLAH